jgi:hypothetical protein
MFLMSFYSDLSLVTKLENQFPYTLAISFVNFYLKNLPLSLLYFSIKPTELKASALFSFQEV